MIKVLCFGDSNTWGYVPEENRRYSSTERWPCLLKTLLPDEYKIIEAGMPGRTTFFNEPTQGFQSGAADLDLCVKKHSPDLLLLMLGTNDLYPEFEQSAEDISHNIKRMIQDLLANDLTVKPKVLVVSPPPIVESGSFGSLFNGGEAKSHQLADFIALRAAEMSCEFLDAGLVVSPNKNEGVHWPVEQHRNMAIAIATKLGAIS